MGGEGTATHCFCSSEQAAMSSCSRNRNVPAEIVSEVCCQNLGVMFCLCKKKTKVLPQKHKAYSNVFSRERCTAEDECVRKEKLLRTKVKHYMFSLGSKCISWLSSKFRVLAPNLAVKISKGTVREPQECHTEKCVHLFAVLYSISQSFMKCIGQMKLNSYDFPVTSIMCSTLLVSVFEFFLFLCSDPHFLCNRSHSENSASGSLLLCLIYFHVCRQGVRKRRHTCYNQLMPELMLLTAGMQSTFLQKQQTGGTRDLHAATGL